LRFEDFFLEEVFFFEAPAFLVAAMPAS
jgi:hypothetical protein